MAQLKDDTEPPDIEELLADLGLQLDRLKQLYEMYFLGIEKIEPLVARKQVQRAMLGLQQLQIRNTGLRFKFNSLLQKWNIYQTYWGRTVREIDNGTYVRHLAKARRAAEREGKDLPLEVLRIRERIAAAQAHAETQPPSLGVPEPAAAAPEATARLAAAAERATKKDEYNEFRDMRAFLDLDTDSFPRVEDDGDEAPAPAPPPPVAAPAAAAARAPSQPAPPAPPQRAPSGPLPPRPPPPPGARPSATQTTPAVPQPRPAATQTTPAVPRPAATQTTPAVPPRPATTQVTPAVRPPVNIPGMEERELRDLHQRYIASRKATGEGANVSYDSLVNSLAKQVPKVLEQKGVKAVRFEVVTQNGKTVLKAIPQK